MSDPFADIDLEETEFFVPASSLEVLPPARAAHLDPWPPRLPLEVALCSSFEEQQEVISRFGLTVEDFARIDRMPEFRRAVAEQLAAIRAGGYGFRIKCEAIAEDFLPEIDKYLHDPAVGVSTKLQLFQTVTKLADLVPKEKQATAGGAQGPQVNIQINLGG